MIDFDDNRGHLAQKFAMGVTGAVGLLAGAAHLVLDGRSNYKIKKDAEKAARALANAAQDVQKLGEKRPGQQIIDWQRAKRAASDVEALNQMHARDGGEEKEIQERIADIVNHNEMPRLGKRKRSFRKKRPRTKKRFRRNRPRRRKTYKAKRKVKVSKRMSLKPYEGSRKLLSAIGYQMLVGPGYKLFSVPFVPNLAQRIYDLAGTTNDARGVGAGAANYIVTGTTTALGPNDVFELYNQKLKYTLKNTGGSDCVLHAYKCKARSILNVNEITNMAITQSPHVAPLYEGFKDQWPASTYNFTGTSDDFGVMPATTATTYPNGVDVFAPPMMTPYHSSLFCSKFKIVKSWKCDIMHEKSVELKVRLKNRKYIRRNDFPASPAVDGRMLNKGEEFVLFTIHGFPAYAVATTQTWDFDPGGTGFASAKADVSTEGAQVSIITEYSGLVRAWASQDMAKIGYNLDNPTRAALTVYGSVNQSETEQAMQV